MRGGKSSRTVFFLIIFNQLVIKVIHLLFQAHCRSVSITEMCSVATTEKKNS